MKLINSKIRLAVLALIPVVAGCSHSEPKADNEFFRAEDSYSPVTKFADTQAACGARQDGSLYQTHFDGGSLNSLGEAKLESLLRDDDAGLPLTVYIAGAHSDAMTDARWKSVTAFLKDHGLKDSQIKIQDGPNPTSYSKTAMGLSDLHKANTASAAGAGASADTSGASAATGGK